MDMEAWRRTAPYDSALRDQRAIDIKKNYLNKKYFFGLNSPAGIDGQNKVMFHIVFVVAEMFCVNVILYIQCVL